MPDVTYKTTDDFLSRMDAGDFDGNLYAELKNLSQEQLSQLAIILLERSAKPRPRKQSA